MDGGWEGWTKSSSSRAKTETTNGGVNASLPVAESRNDDDNAVHHVRGGGIETARGDPSFFWMSFLSGFLVAAVLGIAIFLLVTRRGGGQGSPTVLAVGSSSSYAKVEQ